MTFEPFLREQFLLWLVGFVFVVLIFEVKSRLVAQAVLEFTGPPASVS